MKTVQATLLAAALAGLATARPSNTEKRQSPTGCEQYSTAPAGPYTIENNLWGEGSANSGGSQCYTINSVSGNNVGWSSTWSWTGNPTSVKSYTNLLTTVNQQISSLTSIPSSWQWSYSGSNIADVSYDMFTAASPSGAHVYEIMIWLAALGGAEPIANSYGASGAVPTATDLSIGSNQWNLYQGPNGDTTVYSFVATSEVNDFSGDIVDFINYLVDNEGVAASQYLLSVQAGTEAFSGSGTFTTSQYSLTVSG